MKREWWLLLSIPLAAVLVAGGGILGGMKLAEDDRAKDTYITYSFNEATETWDRTDVVVPLPNNPDGTKPLSSNTVIIKIDEDNPIKLLLFAEAVVKGGNEPIFEINGHDSGGSGKLNIANLVFEKVDTEKLKIDADVVHVNVENSAAKDNEIDLDLTAVNVVRAGRGGTSVMYFGTSESDVINEIDLLASDFGRTPVQIAGMLDLKNTGVRIDRVRILGPSSGTGFIESIVIRRTSVFGEIRVENVEINNLIVKDVSADDSIDSSIP